LQSPETQAVGGGPRSGPGVGRARAAVVALVIGYLAVAALAGAPGSPLVPPYPPRAGRPAWTMALARWTGLSHVHGTALIVLSLVVLAALVALFLVALRHAWRGRLTANQVMVAA